MIAHDRMSAATSTRPSAPRVLVILTALGWLVFASLLPYSLDGLGILVLLALVGLDIALGITTGWLAFQPTSRLDERQAGLRDRAYRIGFRLIGIGVVLMVLLGIAGTIAGFYLLGPQSHSLSDGFSARTVVALLELLAIAPTAVVAWFVPADDVAVGRGLRRWLPLLAVPLVALVWLVAVLTAPIQTTTSERVQGSLSMSEATCSDFDAAARVAAGFGGSVRLMAEICWNGQQAFAVGEPSLPRPDSLPAEEFSHPMPGLTSCAPQANDTDFGSVDQHCVARIDSDGTLHYTVIGHVAPVPGGMGSRDVRIDLVVRRDGKVVTFG